MLENIRKKLALSLYPTEKKAAPPRNLSSFTQPGQANYPEMTIRKATREGYKLSLYVYRCVRTIVQAGSGIPWVAIKNGEIIENHPFEQLMKRPNPEMSGQDLMEFLIAHLKLVGNALWQPLMVNGQPRELWIVMPDLVKPIPSTVPGEWLSGYEVTEPGGRQHDVPPETFIHFMQFDPGNPYWGVGDLMAAARTVDTDNEAQDTQKISMQNRGVPSGVFQHSEYLTDKQFEEQNRRVAEIFLEKTKRRAPWVLGAGATWQQMSLTPVEMDYIQTRIHNKQDIAAAFGLDPYWLGDKTSSTFNNIQEARKSLYQDCVLPLLDDIKSTMNLKVAPFYPDIDEITYDTSGIAALSTDFGQKVEQATRLWAMGVPFNQINENLELGFEAIDGGDTGYLPFSVAPVGQAVEPVLVKTLQLKVASQSDESKTAYWKRVDSRRMAYARIIEKKVLALYKAEGEAVASAIEGQKSVKFSAGELRQIAEAEINGSKDKWQALLKALGLILIEDFGKQTAQDYGFVFDPTSAAIKEWVTNHAAESVTSILETNLEDVKRVILAGIESNATRYEIAQQLRQFYDDGSISKAMRVARTECASAAGYGQHSAAEQGGMETKTWISSRDDRVRDAHQPPLDGETQSLDEPYSNGLLYPGDPSGDPSEFINCRCAEQFS